jgi:hypothetical protein
MRMKGTKSQQAKHSGRSICPNTGRVLIDRGYYVEMLPPPIPLEIGNCNRLAPCGFGKTVEDIIKQAHYILASNWNYDDKPATDDIMSVTYTLAVSRGWKGHMTQWVHNVYAGSMRHGSLSGKIPDKIQLKLRETR